MWDTLLRRNRERGTTILLVTHNLYEAERVVQRVAIMHAGRMLAVGRPGALKARLTATAQSVRVELTLAPPADDAAQALRHHWAERAQPAGPDRWTVMVSREELGTVVQRLLTELGEQAIEDLRLQTHSLEDLYLAYGAGLAQVEERGLALVESGV